MPNPSSRNYTRTISILIVCLPLSAIGCQARAGHDPKERETVKPAELPLLVPVAGGDVQSGFATGTMRARRSLEPFRITQHPITRAEFRACVEAGACDEADTSACGEAAYTPYPGYEIPDYAEGAGQTPATCVGETQAEAFCSWIGGRLPTLDEWLLAARGDQPRRFAWGDAPSACDQHPLAPQLIARALDASNPDHAGDPGCETAAFDGSELDVGQHRPGASPSGTQDVLLTPAELLGSDSETMFNACANDGGHCVVFGLVPAGIDAVEPFYAIAKGSGPDGDGRVSMVGHAYGFRCVLSAQTEREP